MLDLRLLRRPAFLTSLTGALVVGLTTVALMSYAPSFLERALGWSALASSALLATWSTTSAVAAWQAHRMPSRVITRHRLALGLAICLLGLLWLGQLSPAGGWSGLLPGMLVTGVGTGLANAALGQLAVSSAPARPAGAGQRCEQHGQVSRRCRRRRDRGRPGRAHVRPPVGRAVRERVGRCRHGLRRPLRAGHHGGAAAPGAGASGLADRTSRTGCPEL
jgi:hypothetical protein